MERHELITERARLILAWAMDEAGVSAAGRSVLAAHFIEGMPCAAIAAATNRTDFNVRKILSRSQRKLQRHPWTEGQREVVDALWSDVLTARQQDVSDEGYCRALMTAMLQPAPRTPKATPMPARHEKRRPAAQNGSLPPARVVALEDVRRVVERARNRRVSRDFSRSVDVP